MMVSQPGFKIYNLAKLLNLLDSETEVSEFSSGYIQNDKLCIFTFVTLSEPWWFALLFMIWI